jgi:hypothetical protein
VKGFIRAYNAGDLTSAVSQFSHAQALGFSDCDYSTQQLVDWHRRAALVAWLRQSVADHDRLTIGDIAGTGLLANSDGTEDSAPPVSHRPIKTDGGPTDV